MNWSKADNKLHQKSLQIYKYLHTKKTKELAQKYRKEAHIERADFITQYSLQEKIKHFDILLQGEIKKKFLAFWSKLIKENIKIGYILNDPKLRYFIAELFFCDYVSEEVLRMTNISGVEWIDYSQHKGDNNLYLKISPGVSVETVKDFISSNRFSVEKAFIEKRNLPYLTFTLDKAKEGLSTIKHITRWYYEKFTIDQLHTLARHFNKDAYGVKLKSLTATEKSKTKLWLIAFILIHSGLKKRCSVKTVEGYIFNKH